MCVYARMCVCMCVTVTGLSNVSINQAVLQSFNLSHSGVSQFTLADYSYVRDDVVRLMVEHLSQTNFTGITVSFLSHIGANGRVSI